jgi:hypothetical protein
MRQLGSQRACQAAAACESASSHAATVAGTPQPVNTATKPTGIASPSSGTITTFADRPENDTRWK